MQMKNHTGFPGFVAPQPGKESYKNKGSISVQQWAAPVPKAEPLEGSGPTSRIPPKMAKYLQRGSNLIPSKHPLLQVLISY